MDYTALQTLLEQAGPASIGVGFVAGFLFSFNPVALAAIPVSLAYVTKAHEPRRALHLGAMFIAGMILTHGVLGAAAGLGGLGVQAVMGREWGLVLGPFLILLGLLWPGWIRLPLPVPRFRARRPENGWGAFLLGIPFSLAVCPFCASALVIALGVVAAIGSPLFGVTLLLAFALGRALPILLGAWAVGWLERLKPLRHAQRAFELFGAVVLILSGIYLLNAYFFFIPALAG